jgi:DNA-binding CsgD family transcriptional regulator
VLRLASLLLEVGQDGDASLMLQAGREAIRRFDYGLAERFARAAARDPGASPAAEILLSEALIGQGRWADGELMLTRAASRCRTDGERVEVTIGRAQHLFWRLKQPADAVQAIADAVDHATDPIGREDLIANEAALALFGGRTIHAIKRARPVIERGIAKDGAVLLAGATTALGLALMGRVSETREVLTRTLDLGRAAAPSANFPFMAQWLGLVAGQAALFDGQIDQAVKDFTAANAALGDVVTDPRSATLFFLGFGRRVQGRVRTAADHLRQAVALLRDSDLYNHLPACLAELAHALALAGDVCGSEAALQEAEQRKTAAFVVDEVYFALARVRLAEAMGNRAGALARVREGAERLESLSYWPLAGLVLYERARLGHAREVQDRLARLAADVGGGLLPLLSDAAAALAAGDAPRLETASHRLEHAGGLLYAAEASAAAARAHEQAGRRAASAAAHERTRALAAQCEDVRHLADVQLDLERTLTPREREIALLASAGKSSREISTTLRLSIRTVENHLQAVYSKLGVAGRTGLMRVLSNSGCTTDFT